jgi:thiamine biosynthesis lipoprotein
MPLARSFGLFTHASAQDSQHERSAGYRLAHNAMATTWELFCFDEAEHDCEHAAELAFEQVDQIENQLSFFLDSSDIGRLNEAEAAQAIRVSPDTFECLRIAKQMHRLTGGAFDPTVGALLTGRQPWHLSEVAIPEGVPPDQPQPDRLGFDTIALNPGTGEIARLSERVRVDLGAIGKGFAVDQAIEVLADWLEGEAMVVAGQSTMRPLRAPRDGLGWVMGIHVPGEDGAERGQELDRIMVMDHAVSAAAPIGSGHVLDPRTGQSGRAAVGAWAAAGNGAVSDALATAALVMSEAQLADCCQQQPGLAMARLTTAERFETYGQWNALRAKMGGDGERSA